MCLYFYMHVNISVLYNETGIAYIQSRTLLFSALILFDERLTGYHFDHSVLTDGYVYHDICSEIGQRKP